MCPASSWPLLCPASSPTPARAVALHFFRVSLPALSAAPKKIHGGRGGQSKRGMLGPAWTVGWVNVIVFAGFGPSQRGCLFFLRLVSLNRFWWWCGVSRAATVTRVWVAPLEGREGPTTTAVFDSAVPESTHFPSPQSRRWGGRLAGRQASPHHHGMMIIMMIQVHSLQGPSGTVTEPSAAVG